MKFEQIIDITQLDGVEAVAVKFKNYELKYLEVDNTIHPHFGWYIQGNDLISEHDVQWKNTDMLASLLNLAEALNDDGVIGDSIDTLQKINDDNISPISQKIIEWCKIWGLPNTDLDLLFEFEKSMFSISNFLRDLARLLFAYRKWTEYDTNKPWCIFPPANGSFICEFDGNKAQMIITMSNLIDVAGYQLIQIASKSDKNSNYINRCPGCGRLFAAKRKNQKFCRDPLSQMCDRRIYHRKNKETKKSIA